jgi:putative pyruvate formate lyase activating enzyme
MLELTGPLAVDGTGIATAGVIIRHLVLPGGLAGTPEVMRFIARELDTEVPVSLMGQFFPAHQARSIECLNRKLTAHEYAQAKRAVRDVKIDCGWFQVEPEACGPYTAVETTLGQNPKGVRS